MTVFILGVVDTTGTFIALENEMGMLDKEGRLIDVQKPFIVDSLTIMFAGVIGTISSGGGVRDWHEKRSAYRLSSLLIGVLSVSHCSFHR